MIMQVFSEKFEYFVLIIHYSVHNMHTFGYFDAQKPPAGKNPAGGCLHAETDMLYSKKKPQEATYAAAESSHPQPLRRRTGYARAHGAERRSRGQRICARRAACDVAFGFAEAVELARRCGFDTFWRLTAEGFVPEPLLA